MIADSLYATRNSDDITFNFVGEIDEKKWYMGVDYTKPNLGNVANQTQIDHFNGESYSLDFNLRQFLVAPPRLPQAREYFHVRQKWEGYVIEVGQDTFLARLVPIIGEGSDLEAEIYLEDVDLPDRTLVEPGAVFYWSIGYLVKPSGNTLRASLIRFRRLPPWTEDKLKTARIKAEKLMSLL